MTSRARSLLTLPDSDPDNDPWVGPWRQRLRLMPKQLVLILGVMLALLAFVFVALGGGVLVGKALSSGHTEATIQARPAKLFGSLDLVKGQDYRAFDASGDTPGQMGPGTLTVGNKQYDLKATTPLYGAGCPRLEQADIPFAPPCFAQLGLSDDGKTITFVTTMQTLGGDGTDDGRTVSYKGTVTKSSTSQLVVGDGTVLRWGDNPIFNDRCRGLTRTSFTGVAIEAKLDRFVGRILEVDCPDRTPAG